MALLDTIQRIQGKGNDIRRRVLLTTERCFLLRPGGETSSLAVITELTSGFWVRWSEFRQQTQFRYASTEDMVDKFARTTHIAYGVPDSSAKIEVYVIEEPNRDIVAPTASSPFWKAYANKERSLRFTIPTPAP